MLSVQDVTVRFGGVVSLNSVSIEVETGERLGLVGPNGAGKSTLVNCISCQIRPTSGVIKLGDRSLARVAPHKLRAMGVSRTFQNFAFASELTVRELLAVGAYGLGRRNRRNEIDDILERLSIGRYANVRCGELSSGVMRLAEVGRAFIGRPSLVLLDEPAAGIDPVDKVGLVNAVESLLNATDDVTFLLIEHDMSVVRKLTRSAVAIASGSVTVRGRVEDVLSDPQVVADFLGPDSGSPGVDETKGDAALNQEEDSKRKGEDL